MAVEGAVTSSAVGAGAVTSSAVAVEGAVAVSAVAVSAVAVEGDVAVGAVAVTTRAVAVKGPPIWGESKDKRRPKSRKQVPFFPRPQGWQVLVMGGKVDG